jgi:tetratricopeptide (TPR) repeat protein
MTVNEAINLAIEHHRAGRLAEAEGIYRRILAVQPDCFDALNNLGIIAHQVGRNEIAVELIRQAIALRPGSADAQGNLGAALRGLGRHDEAIAAFGRALAARPDSAGTLNNLGLTYFEKGAVDEAIATFAKAIALAPTDAEIHYHLGICLLQKGMLDEAIREFRSVIALRPEHADAHNVLGVALKCKGELQAAIKSYRRAIAIAPSFPEPHCNLALMLLATGSLREGWKEYEWRWKHPNFPSIKRTFSKPRWDGSEIHDKTILIHGEQGMGDCLQFVRLTRLLSERGCKVIFESPKPLAPLLSNSADLLGATIVVQEPSGRSPDLDFDLHLPLLSLPLVMNQLQPWGPAGIFPYVRADENLRRRWKDRLHAAGGFRVGIAWAGSRTHLDDRYRSMTLECLAPIAREKISFISLQIGDGSAQAKHQPVGMKLFDWTESITDFAATAALVAELDLVICVDTAAAHLAGALHKPVWVLLPFVADFRWGISGDKTAWYPSMKLFRQTAIGKWDDVVARVGEELDRVIAALQR